ncbi:MAG: type I-U CRISPR-associated protein Csx17 [Actinomycetota bacterium]|nr:type I-U CRISPR-associated protein Csx17 [Actinomycetota bacterium]
MTEVLLEGCTPEPLGAYLKALGILRVVSEQADPRATGHWRGDAFVLTSRFDAASLTAFFLDEYVPTPVVSPWNNGSGFAGGSKGPQALAQVRDSSTPRLAPYRRTIEAAACIHDAFTDEDRKGRKREIVLRCRAELTDEALPWLDAAVVLTDDGLGFPPLLGTGGNDGRLDFSVAYLGRVADVLCLGTGRGAPTRETSKAWLAASLHGTGEAALRREPVGQFSPGAAGGVNSGGAGAAPSLVNPWDWVLLCEGAMAFAGGVARRLSGGAAGRALMPFTVTATPEGYASSSDAEDNRGELWAPLWDEPATGAEVSRLLAEGRADWRRRQARSGVDLARAAVTLGVDRGIDSFVRHALVTRNGLATLAVPVGRVAVTSGAVPHVSVAGQLDNWVDRVRAAGDPPAEVRTALRALERAQFALVDASDPARPGALQDVLIAAARLEGALARAAGFRASARLALRPIGDLHARDWWPLLLDGTAELNLAAALASLRDERARDDSGQAPEVTLRRLLRPYRWEGKGLAFDARPPQVRPEASGVAALLAAAHHRREVVGRPPSDQQFAERAVGVRPWFDRGLRAPLSLLTEWLEGGIDETRLGRLLDALLLLSWSARPYSLPGDSTPPAHLVPLEVAALAPFYAGRPIETSGTGHDEGLAALEVLPRADWLSLLSAGRVAEVASEALRRLRIVGLHVPGHLRVAPVHDDPHAGRRLAAALLVRLGDQDLKRALGRISPALPTPTSADVTDELEESA